MLEVRPTGPADLRTADRRRLLRVYEQDRYVLSRRAWWSLGAWRARVRSALPVRSGFGHPVRDSGLWIRFARDLSGGIRSPCLLSTQRRRRDHDLSRLCAPSPA